MKLPILIIRYGFNLKIATLALSSQIYLGIWKIKAPNGEGATPTNCFLNNLPILFKTESGQHLAMSDRPDWIPGFGMTTSSSFLLASSYSNYRACFSSKLLKVFFLAVNFTGKFCFCFVNSTNCCNLREQAVGN